MADRSALQYSVSVRALCAFTAKTGDLDLRFTPSPTAQEGQEGHAVVAARRGPGWQRERALSAAFEGLTVRGRADGWDASRRRLEEIKTHRGRLDRQPDNHRALHWAQALVYGWMVSEEDGLDELEVALVYFDIGTQRETVLTRHCRADELRTHFECLCRAFLAWAAQESRHRAARDAALATLQFPHAGFRAGQRALAEAVFKVTRAGRCLLAQAPTGIGKTVGTLFPVLRAAPAQGIDRVFALTAKTSGRALVLEAAVRLRTANPGLPLRTLELVARDKACEHQDKACHGASCPLAKGFYDRLPAAREAALALPQWDRDAVRGLAAAQAVCPYYLTQELAHWADVVVGDYNHVFDPYALLHALAQSHGWRVAVLVDEAHNLVDRARGMYSASFDGAALKPLRQRTGGPVKRALGRVQREWTALQAAHPDAYQVLPALPQALLEALQQASAAIVDHLAEHPAEADAALQGFHLEALHLLRLAESFGPHSLVDLGREGGKARLHLRNVVPASFLAPRFGAVHSTTLYSATLQAQSFHRQMLGLPESTAWIDVDSPFDATQLAVHVAGDISTRWQHRAASCGRIVALIARQYDERPGPYLAFFSSFDYLDQVADAFAAAHPEVPLWRQQRGMREAEQDAFLARFVPGARGIGFAVLGGAFAEGIDLPGDRLVGAFIATLGLPQVNPVNEQVRERLQQLFGRGFDYAYLHPGLQKVVQAAGRVIRTPEDRGVVHLVDDRFHRRDVRALLPAWWSIASDRPPRPGGEGVLEGHPAWSDGPARPPS